MRGHAYDTGGEAEGPSLKVIGRCVYVNPNSLNLSLSPQYFPFGNHKFCFRISESVSSFVYMYIYVYIYVYIYILSFSRAAPTAHRGSQPKSPIGAVATGLHQSHSNAGSEPHLWLPSQLTVMPDSLTPWVRPGIEPATSWFLVRFVNYCATTGTPLLYVF